MAGYLSDKSCLSDYIRSPEFIFMSAKSNLHSMWVIYLDSWKKVSFRFYFRSPSGKADFVQHLCALSSSGNRWMSKNMPYKDASEQMSLEAVRRSE